MHVEPSAPTSAAAEEVRASDPAGELSADPRFAPYKNANLLLRGRYRYLLPMMCILGLAGMVIGFKRKHVMYYSDGLIHMAPRLPAVMQITDQNSMMQMYHQFVQSQALLIGSRPVLELAVADPELQKTVGGFSPGVDWFAAGLDVESPADTEEIIVGYLSTDPNVAAASVRAVIRAYVRTYARNDQIELQRRLAVLADRKATLTGQISQITGQMKQAAVIPAAATIALRDDLMSSYVAQQASLESELNDRAGRDFGPNQPEVKELRARLQRLNERIEEYRQDYAGRMLAAVMRPSEHRRQTGMFPELQSLETTLDKLWSDRGETAHRQDMLSTEARLGAGRVSVQSWGYVPSVPALDGHRSSAALFGLIGGAAPLLLFLAFGILERRYRFSEQAQDSPDELPMLGLIPELPDRMPQEEMAATLANCVHNIRIRLQTFCRSGPHGVFTITSAQPGDGKTSIALSLGYSFAASGARTLLIDCDVIGRGLTHRLECDDEPGLTDCLDDPTRAQIKQVERGLSFLPAGHAGLRGAMAISPGNLRELVSVAAAAYDVVLIDTGPVPACIEASVMAHLSDWVIFVVGQGQQRNGADRAVQTLRSVGAHLAGLVFNRAKLEDYYRSIGGAANAIYKSARRETPQAPAPVAQPCGPAPLAAAAVAASAGEPQAWRAHLAAPFSQPLLKGSQTK